MNSVVRPMRCSDEIVWVNERIRARDDVIGVNWVHVMDQDSAVDLIAFHTEVTTVVSDDYFVTKVFPFPRLVESLVEIAIEAESTDSDLARQREIAKALDESFDSAEFTV